MQYVCIHGHFYQPPRENPWLEVVELQDSAAPFHDWNDRITAECYGPNAWSRILDDQGRIVDIVNNYSRMSFNFGPTLLSWMEEHAYDVYVRILEADRISMKRFGGHGSAMAQSYNHLIMPLANERTKRAQVEWGIKDFQHRFERDPEGMWLSECAVDLDTLEVMAANGIKYTVLAPRQARSFRHMGEQVWQDVSGDQVDTRFAYRCQLSSGKHIDLFFYDGVRSQEVAFKRLLDDGTRFAGRLLDGIDPNYQPEEGLLTHIATDGESYGHHHRFGDMALAVALDRIEHDGRAQLINYGEFLEKHPPTREIGIAATSSWSCVHGVERWRSDCGCRDGSYGNGTLEWRAPLRKALDDLDAGLQKVWDEHAPGLFADAEAARLDYINVILDRSPKSVRSFLDRHSNPALDGPLKGENETTALRLVEMQRQGMLMYTSCGWFFDDVGRIEPVQILRYANRAIQLAESATDVDLEDEFIKTLETAPCNEPHFDNAAEVYKNLVQPNRLTLSKVGMHYAVYSLFEEFPERLDICNYTATSAFYERFEAGNQTLAVGRTTVMSKITHSRRHFSFGVIYLGQHQIIGHFEYDMHEDTFEEFYDEVSEAFRESRVADVLGLMQQFFSGASFSFWNLFRDEQRKVLDRILEADLEQAENSYKKIFDRNYNIMNVLRSAELHIPAVFARNLEVVINTEIRKAFERNDLLNPRKLEKLALQARKWDVPLNRPHIAFAASERLLDALRNVDGNIDPTAQLQRLNRVLKVLQDLEIEPDLWKIQNAYFLFAQSLCEKGDNLSNEMSVEISRLGGFLGVRPPAALEPALGGLSESAEE